MLSLISSPALSWKHGYKALRICSMYMQNVAIYITTFQSTNRVTILGGILFWNSRTNLQSIYTYKFSLIQNNFDTVHMRHSNSVHQTCTYVTICKQSYTENVWQLLSEQDPIMSPVDPYIQMQVKKTTAWQLQHN